MKTNVREKTVDYSLGKHVSAVGRFAAAVIVLLSPALLFAQGDGAIRSMKERGIQFAQFVDTPAVEVPSPSIEGMVNVPADAPIVQVPGEGPLVGDIVPTEQHVMADPAVVQPPYDQGYGGEVVQEPAPIVQSDQYATQMQSPVYQDAYQALQPQASNEPAPVFSTGTWLWTGGWYFNADYMVLKKEPSTGRLVAIDPSNTQVGSSAGGVILSGALFSDSEPHEFESGGRITFGRFLGRDAARRDHMIEASFMGLFDWSSQAELAGSNLITGLSAGDLRSFSPILQGLPNLEQITGFFNNDRIRYEYNSSLDNIEVNYRIRTRPGRDQMAIHPSGAWTRHASSSQLRGFSAGIRAMSIREGFLTEAFTETDRNGMYRVRTANDMIGPQIGVELIETHDFWHWGFRGSAGTLLNFADRRSQVETLLEVPDGGVVREEISGRSQVNDEEQLSFVGQVGLYGAIRLRPNMSIKLGYNFMYVAGLAIAPNNARLGEDEFPAFHTTGDALYHGATIGFEQQF